MYVADGLFNTPNILLSHAQTTSKKITVCTKQVSVERKGKFQAIVFISGQITFRVLFSVPATK